MKAHLIDSPGNSRVGDAPDPTPGPGEVLLRIRTVGFCGSDLNTFRGRNPLVAYPRIPGHEIGATIEAVGEGVGEPFVPGLDVTVSPYSACGECSACRQGRVNACRNNQTLGVQRDGALSEWAVVPADKLLTAPGLSLRELALVEPLTIGEHAVARSDAQPAETVAVLGCGAIGLGVVAAAARRDTRVIAVDIDDGKLAVARAAGAVETINTASHDLHDRLQALTDGEGPRVVVEAIGLPQTFRAAAEEVCYAGRVVYIGYCGEPVAYETKQFILKELDIRGSRNALRVDFEAVIAMLQAGAFPVDEVITETVPLDDAPRAMAAWAARPADYTKIQVEVAR